MNKPIIRMQFGSHVYGTNVPTSDLDYKGIFIPNGRDIVMGRAAKNINLNTNKTNEKNSSEDIDEEHFSLSQYLKHLSDGQTVALDMLFTPDKFIMECNNEKLWAEIKDNRHKLIHRGMSAFVGYCQAQAAKYSLKGSHLAAYRAAKDFFGAQDPNVKLIHREAEMIEGLINPAVMEAKYHEKGKPLIKFVEQETNLGIEKYIQVGPKCKVPLSAKCGLAHQIYKAQFDKYGERAKMAETNQGIDWKALMHAVRVCYEAQELLKTHSITFPRPEADLLLKIRKGELSYKEVEQLIVQGIDDLDRIKEGSTLPEKSDHKLIEDIVYREYVREVMQFRG